MNWKTFHKRSLGITLILAFIFNADLAGQSRNSIFTLTSDSYQTLSIPQQLEVDRISDDEIVTFEAFASYLSLEDAQEAGLVDLIHPITGELMTFQVTYTEFFDEGYYWYGEARQTDATISMSLGTLALAQFGGYTFGDFTWQDKAFQFESIGGDRLMIYQLSEDDLIHCGDTDNSTGVPPPPPVPPVNHCDVDIVALYTEKFRKKVDGNSGTSKTRAVIQAKIAESNRVIALSKLDVYFKFRLVGIVASAFVEDELIMLDEKNKHLNSSSQSGEMFLTRQSHEADISMIFTHGKYEQDIDQDGKGDGRIGGTSGSTMLQADLTYALVEHKGLKNKKKNKYTSTHELCHLIRATHTATSPGALPYGSFIETSRSGWQFTFRFNGTLMQAGPVGGVIHREFLSNPDIVFEGAQLGIENEKDNARVVSENVCTVSAFEGGVNPTGKVDISFFDGPFCTCNPEVIVKAIPHFGIGPYTYEWSSSEDGGFTFLPFGGNTDRPDYVPPCGLEDEMTVVIKVKVTDSQGNSLTGQRNLRLEAPEVCREEDDRGDYRKRVEALGFRLDPNPVKGLVQLSGTLPKEYLSNPLRVEIYNISGVLVFSKNLNLEDHFLQESFDLGSLASSMYLFRISTEENLLWSKYFTKI